MSLKERKSTNGWIILMVILPVCIIVPTQIITNGTTWNYSSPWSKKVLAFYYGWFGLSNTTYGYGHWNDANHRLNMTDPANASRPYITCTEWPSLGLYNSSDPAVVVQHQIWAEQAGLDAFICSWWGPNASGDRNLFLQLEKARERNSSLQFCIDYETMIAVNAKDTVKKVVDDFTYILDNFVNIPDSHFLCVDGKPVIYMYRADWIMPAEWREILRQLPQQFFIIADLFPPIQEEYLNIFDGLHQYDTTQALNLGRDVADLFESMSEISHSKKKLFSACVLPGFNKTQLKQTPYFELPRNNGDTYRDQWKKATDAEADWISIVSWSEWAEGTQIEPAYEYNDLYLNLTRELSTAWKS